MSDQPPSSIGTVAEEAARLIAAVATMARAGAAEGDEPSHRSSPYAGWPAQDDGAPPPEGPSPTGARSPGSTSTGSCASCGRDSDAAPDSEAAPDSDGTPFACRVCPLCQGIALLRSVRPETVDRLADFAVAVAGSLREMATMSRADGQDSQARPTSGSSSRGATVQDIRVDDEDEG